MHKIQKQFVKAELAPWSRRLVFATTCSGAFAFIKVIKVWMKWLHRGHLKICSTRCRQRESGEWARIMNESGPRSCRAVCSHVILNWHASVSLCAPFLLTGHQNWILFIHSFILAIVPVSFDSPHLPSPLGALNGSWRRCGTLCCLQEALLNTLCPVALSLFSSILLPHLSIETCSIVHSHHKVQYYVLCLACCRNDAHTLRLGCFFKGIILVYGWHWFQLYFGAYLS